ncbi:MAG: LON peptidase substrate-binding domain-containing protein [Terracidiphilus sp.]
MKIVITRSLFFGSRMVERNGNDMMRSHFDLESKLLLAAIGTCILGAMLLIRPELKPISVSTITIVVIGEILALWCSDNGPHAVTKLAVLSVCFATQSAAFIIRDRHFMLSAFFAVVAVYCIWSAFGKVRKIKQESIALTTPSKSDTVLQKARDVTSSFTLPMIPIRDMVIVTGMTIPLMVGRESSVRALEYADANNTSILFASQHDDAVDAPRATEISKYGCVCKVLQSIKMTDGNFKVLVEGHEMAKAVAIDDRRGFFIATVQSLNIKGEAAPTSPAA